MNSVQAQYIKMTETPVPKLIVTLGIPTIISMLITNIYNMADTFFVGRLETNSASGAIGVVFSLMAVLQAFGFMFGNGAGCLISRRLGQQDSNSASRYASLSFFTALLTGVVIGALGIIFIEPFMLLLGSTYTILEYARIYAFFILAVAPFMVSSFVLNNILRYEGKALFAMIGLTTGGLLNIIGDPIFMFKLDMGIAGAGLSTALSQCISFMILLFMFLSGKTQSKISLRYIKAPLSGLCDIIRNGFPSVIRQGLGSISTVLLNQQAAVYGDAAVAAMSIVSRISMFIFAICIGTGQGFQPVAGFNYGAKKYSRVKKGFYFTFLMGETLVGIMTLICLVFSGSIVGIFRNDLLVIECGVPALRYHCVALLVQPICLCANMLFQSVGRSGLATFTATLRNGLYFVPFILILPYFMGITGIQITQMFADILSVITVAPIVLHFIHTLPKDGEDVTRATVE